jgi:flagellar motor switch protein FliG
MVGLKAQTALRKAAILVSALDHRTADVLLERIPEEQATRIRNAVLQLSDVSDEEQQIVLREFLRAGNSPAPGPDEGVELDESLVQKIAAAPAERREAAAPPLFRTLQLAAPESLAQHLQQEHPQIIAVVLAHLPPARSADVVKRLPERLQVDVLRRVAELDRADPQVLRDLEFELEQRLSDEIRTARNRTAGLSAVASILAAAGNDREVIVRSVSRHDEQFSSLLGVSSTPAQDTAADSPAETGSRPRASQPPAAEPELTLDFADLELLDDRGLATLFATADSELVLVALSGAGESLLVRLMRQLPARQARLVRRSMERLGPLRLSDVEHAQRQIAALAAELITEGALVAPTPRGWSAAA